MFDFFIHYPSKVLHVGGTALGVSALLATSFILPILSQPSFPFSRKPIKKEEPKRLSPLFSQELRPPSLQIDFSYIEEALLLALCPGRPDLAESGPMAYVKIKGSKSSKQIHLPGKIGLFFNERGDLCFREATDRFWLEVELQEDSVLSASIFYEHENAIRSTRFQKSATSPIVHKPEDLPNETPFQELAKARLLGKDLICMAGSGDPVQKIEIGSLRLDVLEKTRLFWNGAQWVKAQHPGEGKKAILAEVYKASAQGLELDVWDPKTERHLRVAIPLISAAQSRIKPEEWFSSIRIRSDKQISCLLEKQCLILRNGDWVLKENGRWRVFRKAEDKQQVIQGKRTGDLIILEAIDAKQRVVHGQLILANRVSGVPFMLSIAAKSEKRTAPLSDRLSRTGKSP